MSLKAKAYILGVILAGGVLLVVQLSRLNPQDIGMLAVLSVLASLSLIYKVEGPSTGSSQSRLHYNISFLFYAFTFFSLGAPAAALVILVSNLVEWVKHKYPWYIQLFNIGMYFLVLQFTELVFHAINPQGVLLSFLGILSILVAMAAFMLLNHLLVGMVVWLARGDNFAKSGVFDFLPLMIDFTILCMGAGAVLIYEVSPFGVVLSLIPLYLIYVTLRVPALERQSELDPKTGLYNARYFEQALKNELERANRFDRPLTVVMSDLDLLRNINNTYGHLAGDQVLIGVAKIFKQNLRDYDLVARFGGEEYAVLIPEADPEDVYQRIDTIRSAIEKAEFIVPTSITPIKATMSFGIAGRQGFNQTPGDIVHNADTALYHAKLQGRNLTYVFNQEVYTTLFNRDQILPAAAQEEELQERIRMSSNPYQPSSLRQPPPVVQEEQKPSQVPVVKSPFGGYLVNLLLVGMLAAAILLFYILYTPGTQTDWLGLAAFCLMVILTEWYSIDLYVRDTSVSTSAAPMLGAALLYGPLGAIAVSVSFAAVAMIKHHSRISRFIFNASNQSIANLLCCGIIGLSGAPFQSWSVPAQLVITAVGGMVVYLSTTFGVAAVMKLDLGLPFGQVWKEKFSWLAPYYFTMGLIAYALTFSYQAASYWGLLVILIPLAMLRLSQKQYIDRTKAVVKELKENNSLLEKHNQEIGQLNEDLLDAWARVIDTREPYLGRHSHQVSNYAVLVAKRLGLPANRIEHIRKAGLLHDIGKMHIPDQILKKPTSLTPEEFAAIKKHPEHGVKILESSVSLRNVIPIVRHHHERYDGKGYPDGLEGHDIPLDARIVFVADAVEAMASDRPYRKALNLEKIIEELDKNSGTQFDPVVATAMIEILNAQGSELLVNAGQKKLSGEFAFAAD